MGTKFCKFCGYDHVLTVEFWQNLDTNPQCKLYCKDNRKKNLNRTREARNAYQREWRSKNSERMKELQKRHYQKNRKKIIDRNYLYSKERRSVDVSYNLTILLRQRFNKALKEGYKAGSAVRDLGCSIEDFRLYIESKWQQGMGWDNHGRAGWHIDHIVPISSFNLSDREQVKKACHYTNLQPLWCEDNFRKGNKQRPHKAVSTSALDVSGGDIEK